MLAHHTPDKAFHGSTCITALQHGIPAMSQCDCFSRASWPQHDSWMSGGPHLENGIPYANIIWEAVGLRNRTTAPEDVRPWAKSIRSFRQLGDTFGMLFITDRREDAQRYGNVHQVDMASDLIVDIIEDPHVRTHQGWIIIIKAGDQIPFLPD